MENTISKKHPNHHDACGLVARFRKKNLAGRGGSYGVLQRTLDSITHLQKRGGSIQTDWGTDGDGAGVLTDIPPYIAKKDLNNAGLNEAMHSSLAVGVFFIQPEAPENQIKQIKNILREQGLEVLYHRPVPRKSEALGPAAKSKEPKIVRLGVLIKDKEKISQKLFQAQVQIEDELGEVHVVSLSNHSLVYKVMGTGKTLQQYYPELHNSRYKTHLAIGHIRMSTNTQPDFRLAHPYGTMVHNGEINTIDKLIRRARALNIPLPDNPSDTMVVDRILQHLITSTGCSLATAYRMLFPLVDDEIEILPERERQLQSRLKIPFGNLGQGPAGIITRFKNEAVIACDSLALRPMWFGETEKEFYATSERGAAEFKKNKVNPRPVAGGELILLDLNGPREISYPELMNRFEHDIKRMFPEQAREPEKSYYRFPLPDLDPHEKPASASAYQKALGFKRDDVENLRQMAETGEEPLGSVGYSTGSLPAVTDAEQKLIADYCLEKVAVITNPALDSERENRYFSLRVRFGDRGGFFRPKKGPCWEFPSPLIFGPQLDKLKQELNEENVPVNKIFLGKKPDESQDEALKRIKNECRRETEFQILHLHDQGILTENRGLLDPLLGLAAVNKALREANLRANTAILLESRRLRNLHDLMLAYGLGAELIYPVMIEHLCSDLDGARDSEGNKLKPEELSASEKEELKNKRLHNCLEALKTGMKKVISTMGIHEIEGYGRIFSAVGLSKELADLLEVNNYLGSEDKGLSREELAAIENQRENDFKADDNSIPTSTGPWSNESKQALRQVAAGAEDYEQYEKIQKQVNRDNPTAIRHCLNVSGQGKSPLSPDQVDLSAGEHSAPIFFAAMSYGSQNVVSFSAYAEAARQLNLLAVNGEGGEPEHLRPKNGAYRAQQLASGRFGVDTDLLANSKEVEIKIGQGAKPGEGGLLKGTKVNPHIAKTRHTPPFIDLISPANNHDFYSIEDLIPTVINELQVLNPEIKVDIKVPAIPRLAPIVTGLAKEGHPDSITISGYEGSTGAARRHAMKRVGFPVELALNEAHRNLCQAGLRERVELRAEGGMKTVDDMLKLGILGADRVGFGTLCMMAIGCLYCEQCYSNRCPRGIASPFNSESEASANDVPAFKPRNLQQSTEQLVTFFRQMSDYLREQLAGLGMKKFSDLHGQTNFLEENISPDKLDLDPLFKPVNHFQAPEKNEVIRDRLQTSVSSDQASTFKEELEKNKGRHLERLRFVTTLDTTDRAVGSGVSGVMARQRRAGEKPRKTIRNVLIKPGDPCIPGNGLGAFNEAGINIKIQGGAQDGTAKSMSSGRVVILPGENNMGKILDGSVGKSAAYGATDGTLIVAGKYADSRFGVRCSGADLIHLGELTSPVSDEEGLINSRANLKGFAFEYMTSGRGLVLGDPGMDLCSGMTGGVVYLKLNEEMGLTRAALEKRLAPGVRLQDLTIEDQDSITELLEKCQTAIRDYLPEKVNHLESLKHNWKQTFLKALPQKEPTQTFTFFEDPETVINKAYEDFNSPQPD